MKMKHTTLASILLAGLASGTVFADDLSELNAEIAKKADQSYVEEIAKIHDENIEKNYDAIVANSLTAAQIQVNVEALAEELSYKADINDLNPVVEKLATNIEKKADLEYVEEIAKIHDENIEKNYEYIVANSIAAAQIQTNVMAIADELSYKVDIDDLNPVIEQINNDIATNTFNALANDAKIVTKADQSYAEENREGILTNNENIKNNHRAITEHRAVIENIITTVDEKADKVALTQKADKTEVAKKADKAALAEKADKVELTKKADKTALAEKADKVELTKKADKVYAEKTRTITAENRVMMRGNAQQISSNKTNISKLSSRVDNNTAEIKNLGKGIKRLDNKLKNGLATQSALNGLFQPYNVGKLNLTAAVGGYQSKTALAVGTGYRFNENVAAKAGVAVSTSNHAGVAYNVGVNFEW